MENPLFPRTQVGGLSLPRMIIGTNWILGYSHTSVASDEAIRNIHSTPKAMSDVIVTFMQRGVDALMGPTSASPMLLDAMKMSEDRTGKKLIRIDTPIINVDNNEQARKKTEGIIQRAADAGADFCLPHHQSVEQLVCKNTKTIDRLPDYLDMIRQRGMRTGLSGHMPELVVYSDLNGYDVDTYIQIYNCMGFLMQFEIEYHHKVIHKAKKPVMTIKSMAAGRCSPFVGLTFSYATLRECDMVTVGCLTPREAEEDVEIALAAIERRPPDVEGRRSSANVVI
nr:hypothetical protein [bacterium]